MNVYDWMKENEHPDAPPLNEPGTREDPGNRPHVPGDDDGTTRELHSNAGGGRVHEAEEHHVEHTIADPEQAVEESVSNEGLIESVRKLFGVHNRGKYIQVDGDSKARYRNLEDELKTSFADPAWVKQQTPIKGDINVKDISEKANLDDLVSALNDTYSICIRANNAMNEALKKFYTSLKPGLDLFAKAGGINDKAYETLKELVGNTKPASELYKGPQSIKSNQVGRTKDTMPAMPQEEMVSIGSLVAKLLANLNETWLEQASMMERVSPALVDPEFTQYIWAESSDIEHNEKASQYNSEAWRALGQAIDRKANYGVPVVMQATRQFEDACLAAIVYMERSIKGGKVSNEEFTVSNEGIVDKIMKLFTPGKDKDIYKSVDAVSVNVLAKELKEKYANPTWVKRQGVKEGMISLSAANFVDKKYDAEINEHITALKAERSRLDKTLPSALKALGELIAFLPTMTSDKDLAKARELLIKAQEFDRVKFQTQRDTSKPGEVPALTEEEVVSKTRALLAVFEQTEVTSNYRSEFERIVKSSTPGANWYRNWQYVESKSRNGLVAKLNGKVSTEKLNAFLDTYERALTWISNNVPGVADLRPIQAHIRARFEQIEKSVK